MLERAAWPAARLHVSLRKPFKRLIPSAAGGLQRWLRAVSPVSVIVAETRWSVTFAIAACAWKDLDFRGRCRVSDWSSMRPHCSRAMDHLGKVLLLFVVAKQSIYYGGGDGKEAAPPHRRRAEDGHLRTFPHAFTQTLERRLRTRKLPLRCGRTRWPDWVVLSRPRQAEAGHKASFTPSIAWTGRLDDGSASKRPFDQPR
jgi:hypothetical protein